MRYGSPRTQGHKIPSAVPGFRRSHVRNSDRVFVAVRTDLGVAGQISVDVTAQVDRVLLAHFLLDRPHLLLAERGAGRVDLEAERLRRQVLAGVVHQPDLPLLPGRRRPPAAATAELRPVHRCR